MATRVNITKALEARLRDGSDPEKLVGEIVRLLDDVQERAISSKPGLGYKELVALFRLELGDRLIVPMNPSIGYMVRLVNRAKDLGVSKENVTNICKGLRLVYPSGSYRLDFVIGRSDVFFARAESAVGGSSGESVFTGRRDLGDADD